MNYTTLREYSMKGLCSLLLGLSLTSCAHPTRKPHKDIPEKSPVQQKPLAELETPTPKKQAILEYFDLYKQNSDLAKADVILLGDIHTKTTKALLEILPKIVREQDEVLLEQSSDRKDIHCSEEKAIYTSRGEKALQQFYQDCKEKIRKGPAYWMTLLMEGKGTIKFVDAPRTLRDDMDEHNVRGRIATNAKYYLQQDQQLHPFEKWLIYDKLQICKPEDSPTTQLSNLTEYLYSLKKPEGRNEIIVQNVLSEVSNNKDETKSIVVLGQKHIEDIVPALESQGIPYVAFRPKIHAEVHSDQDELLLLSAEYWVSFFVLPYVDKLMRKDPSNLYGEGYIGLAERLCEVLKAEEKNN